MKVSVIIPTYNNQGILHLAIGSILSQETSHDCEIVIADYGSTDCTVECAKGYGSVIIADKTPTLADAINKGVALAQGEKIFILNPKSVLLPNAVNEIAQSEGDITFSGMRGEVDMATALEGEIDYASMVISNKLKGLLFEDYYNDCLYYRFVLRALLRGFKVVEKNAQVTPWTIITPKECIKRMKGVYNSNNEGEITCVIAFRDEGEEVERTISSIRYMARGVKILLVDDCSTDNFNYKQVSEWYNCDYIKTETRIGSAGAKHLGANSCTTKYLCFFDAHQRVHHYGWDKRLVGMLQENPSCIISPRTIIMHKDNGTLTHERVSEKEKCGVSYCAYLEFGKGLDFTPRWAHKLMEIDPYTKLAPVPCVLGACYAMETEHWKKIKGFEGLLTYGLEESLMSIKTWLVGGKCLVVKDWGVSHLYRETNISYIPTEDVDSNRLYLIHLFCDKEEIPNKEKELRHRIGDYSFAEAKRKFSMRVAMLEKFREYFSSIATRGIAYFHEINNKVKM